MRNDASLLVSLSNGASLVLNLVTPLQVDFDLFFKVPEVQLVFNIVLRRYESNMNAISVHKSFKNAFKKPVSPEYKQMIIHQLYKGCISTKPCKTQCKGIVFALSLISGSFFKDKTKTIKCANHFLDDSE